MAASPLEAGTRWFEDVWNRRSDSAIEELLAPQGSMTGLPGGRITGPAEFKAYRNRLLAAFPDFRIEVVRAIEQGEWVAVHCRCTGTHTGDGLPTPPTRAKVDFTGSGMARFVNGKLVEAVNNFDFLVMYQQMGLLPVFGDASK